MDILEAIQSRKSIRGFKPDPVPEEILKEIIKIGTRAPSGLNTQPWEIAVVTGKALDNINNGNVEKLVSGAPSTREIPSKPYEGKYRQRQIELTIKLFEAMNIAREDKEKRAEWQKKGYRFFDAPAAIILSVDKSLNELPAQFNLGLIVQTICLAALHFGLGTCIEYQSITYPEVVRKFTSIPESKRISVGIAIGYPDWDFPTNKTVSKREPLDDVVTWYGFD